ncbi:hypothetical protein [Gaetbulibacter sp. PBL-D1]|uniref:hypothetical protein n=1 Tax=Gaetbulibacter sp. PBL-D1 TaxID=3422594 RepID=UPI003D2EC865
MENKLTFMIKFIDKFYEKSERKRRSSKNQAYYIARTINNVCKSYFSKKLKYREEEIYKAFEINGYTLMESGKEEFTWERFHEGNILILCDLFININSQKNADLKLVMKRTYPESFKPETVLKIDNRKRELKEFWNENQKLILN